MEATERTIGQILTEQIKYQIPPYQRPYSWQKENVIQFLEDIWDAFQQEDPEYFIGSLITIEQERNSLYEVVDGQQRLTTLNLIFARLRDALDEPAKSDLGRRVLPRNPFNGEAETPRLTLRTRDHNFFREYVLFGESIPKNLIDDINAKLDAPKLRIIENVSAIDSFITEKTVDQLLNFTYYVLTKVYVVFVTTSSLQSAYRLFNVLNARGMSLSNSDLIKNMLFSRLEGGENNSIKLNEAWLELEERIGIDQLDQFLAHHRSSISEIKARKALHEEFEPIIESKNSPLQFLSELNNSARNYQRILNNNFDNTATSKAIQSLHRVAFEDWIPPLLAFLNRNIGGIDENEFIDLLERITYQNWIRRLAFTARLTVYFRLVTAIKTGKNADIIRSIFKDNSNDNEFATLIDGEIYGRPFARAVLLRLEDADQDESVIKNYRGRITIEHVLPQLLKEEYWRERFSESEHRHWLHKLGNLALLAGTKNYRAQYFEFERKKAIYEERNNRVSFDTTKSVVAADDWSIPNLAARQLELVSRAKQIWAIEGITK